MAKHPLHILSISQYGSGLADTGEQFSGATERQHDYADSVTRYSVIVPSKEGNVDPVAQSDGFVVYPVKGANPIQFFFNAYKKAFEIHTAHRVHAVMVDNPHVIGVLGFLLKHRLRAVLVVHSMSDMIRNPWYQRERFSNRIKNLFIEFSIRVADFVRVSTAHEVARLRSIAFLNNKLVRVPFYINADAFRTQLGEDAHEHDANSILFVGRLGVQKDIETLLRAFREARQQNPKLALSLIGDGPDRKALEALSRSLGISEHTHFFGKIPYTEVASHFKKAGVFAISSLHEGTCMVLHEAALAELPLVATAFAGARDFIRDEVEGYVVPIRDVSAFSAKLLEVTRIPEKAREMGVRSALRVADFSKADALAHWESLLVKIDSKITPEDKL